MVKATYEVTGEGIKTIEDMNKDCEWEVAYSLKCAKCGEDLSSLVGF
jgi:hypothetical protein